MSESKNDSDKKKTRYFPYVGIIQIRLRVKVQHTYSQPTYGQPPQIFSYLVFRNTIALYNRILGLSSIFQKSSCFFCFDMLQ